MTASTSIKAVIFDADGVVIFPWRFSRLLESQYGITPETTYPFFQGVFNDCMLGKADLRQVLPPYLDIWGWPGTLDDLIETWLEVENAPDPLILASVQALRQSGYHCCLATSQERLRAAYLREAMGFAELFDALFFSCEVGALKPDPAFYQHVAAALDIPGEQILFWDDSDSNILAARACGWNAEIYTGFEAFKARLTAYLPAPVIGSLP